MNLGKLQCLVVGLLLSQALPTQASDLGNITGVVYGPGQEPWDAIEVIVVREGTSVSTSSITDQDGWFRFEGLSPSNYLVSIDEAGLPALDNFKVPVLIGATARLRIDLPLSSGFELPARAEIRAIDIEQTMLGTSLSGTFMQVLPNFASYQAPFIFATSLDGLALGAEQHVLIDGFFISNPASAQFTGNPNLYAMSEIRLFTAGLDAQYGDTYGPMAMISIPEGSNEFKLQTGFKIRPNQTRLAKWVNGDEAHNVLFYQANLNASGPIFKDRLWYFTSVQFDQQLSSVARDDGALNSAIDRYDYEPMDADSRQLSILAKLDWRVTDQHDLSLLAHVCPAWHKNILLDNFHISSEANQQLFQLGSVYGLNWRARWTESLLQETRVSYGLNHQHRLPQSGCTSLNDEACRSHNDSEIPWMSGNSNVDRLDTSHRIAAETSLTWHTSSVLGHHVLKGGLQYSLTWRYISSGIPGGGKYLDRDGRPYHLILLIPNENGELEKASDALGLDKVGIYLHDSWRFGKSLKINLGMRLDLAWLRERSGDQIARSAVFSPRLSIAWDPFQDGKTVIRAGYSRNHANPGMHNLQAWMGTYHKFGFETWEYNRLLREFDVMIQREPGINGPIRPEVIEIDPVPVDSIHFQFEREIFWHMAIGIGALWSSSSYQTTLTPFMTNGCIIESGVDSYCNKYAIQATIIRRILESSQLQVSYTYSRAVSDKEMVDDDPPPWSTQRSSKQHMLSLLGTTKLPHGFYMSGGLRYLKLNREFSLYWFDSWDIRFEPNQLEKEAVYLDLRMAWTREIVPNHRLELSLDFFLSGLIRATDTWPYTLGTEREYFVYESRGTYMWLTFGIRYWF
ncbi:MAG: TonB-dependent receptor [Deltaproteobacteria bacterium]|nr:TonB-dependent receptor [Deltaproteobacteria bacterium]